MKIISTIIALPKRMLMLLIRAYQRVLSPDHSFWAKKRNPHGYCKFFPTCSEYGYQVVEKYGVIRGVVKAVWRVLRCNPWNKGGVDPIEKSK